MSTPGIPQFYLGWSVFSVNSWCWTMFVLYIGMRFLDFSNKWLRYGGETIMPLFVLHQPVIIVMAYFVVQWESGILVKLLVVVFGSFLITLGLVELLIKPFRPIRMLFGMRPKGRQEVKGETPVA
jgi:peptidoglycan/LPS O-acetylase OafA/YrhL